MNETVDVMIPVDAAAGRAVDSRRAARRPGSGRVHDLLAEAIADAKRAARPRPRGCGQRGRTRGLARGTTGSIMVFGASACVAAAVLSGPACAQVKQLTAPNVTVTAPPAGPPYIAGDPWKAYARNPYFGRYRVEENRFAPVPCAQTRIAAGSGGQCLLGYRLTAAAAYMKTGPDLRGSSHCDIALDVVAYETRDLSVEAAILVFDPYKLNAATGFPDSSCYINSYPDYDQLDFQDLNQVTRRGANWHGLQGTGDAKSIEFTDGPHHCAAIRRPGPRWGGGYIYMLTASICRSDAAELEPGDVERGLGSLQIRQYDPVGNLSPPPR